MNGKNRELPPISSRRDARSYMCSADLDAASSSALRRRCVAQHHWDDHHHHRQSTFHLKHLAIRRDWLLARPVQIFGFAREEELSAVDSRITVSLCGRP